MMLEAGSRYVHFHGPSVMTLVLATSVILAVSEEESSSPSSLSIYGASQRVVANLSQILLQYCMMDGFASELILLVSFRAMQ